MTDDDGVDVIVQPPMISVGINDASVVVGATHDVDVSGAFTGTVDSYTASSSDETKATVALVSGTTYRVTAVAVGTATITVEATNTSGSAEQTFDVEVTAAPVQAPTASGTIPDITMAVSTTRDFDVATYFSGTVDTYSASSGDTPAVAAFVADQASTLQLTSFRIQTTVTITVTATNTGGSVDQTFEVTVGPAPAPVATGTIPDGSVVVGEGGYFLDAATYFTGTVDTYTASSGDDTKATVGVAASFVTVTGVAVGTADITVTATNTGGSAEQTFTVTVTPAAPTASGTINAVSVAVGTMQDVDVSSAFTGTVDSYTAVSGAPDKATVAVVSGTTYRVTGVAVGAATITVTATNTGGMAEQTFTVTVTPAVQPNRAPVFTEGADATREFPENTASGQNIGLPLTATDADSDTLTYTLSGTDAGSFNIAQSTGQLSTKSGVTYDFETKSTYSVTVEVSDGRATNNSDSIAVTITLTDVVEAVQPPVASGTIPAVSVAVRATQGVDVSGAFTGTVDTYTADSSDTDKATVAVSGSMVTVTGVAVGTATITVTATNTGGSATQTFTVTVTAAAAAAAAVKPVITVRAVNPSVVEGQPVVFTLTATPPPGASLMVNFNVAFTGGNYVTGISAGPKTRVIGTGGTLTVSFATTDDGAVESDGSVTVTLTTGSGYNVGNPTTASVTVTDNGLPPATAPVASGAIPDITMAVGATQDVNVSGAFTGTVGSYTAVSGATDKATVALVSGTTYRVTGVAVGTALITVTATNTVGSATQTFTVTVAAVVVQLPAPANLSAVWGSDSVVLEWEAVPTATSYNVQWKAAGESYDLVSRQQTATETNHVISGLTPGTAYTVRVAAVLDNVVGVWSDEVTTPAAAVTITGGLRVNEGNPPTGQQRRPVLGYPLTFSPAITETVTVYYAFVRAGTTAAWADDFSYRSSLLAGGPLLDALTATELGRPSVFEISASPESPVTTAYLLVQIREDSVPEADETVQLRLLGAENAALGNTLDATNTIVNDDTQQLIVPDDALFAAEGESLEIIVGLSAASATAVSVTVQDLGTGSATSGTDYPVIPGTLTFEPSIVRQTLSIELTDDTDVEGNETINLRISSGGRPVDVTATIVDEDTTYPAISIAAVDGQVTEGSPAQFEVTASAAPTTDLDVRLSIGQEGAYAADDELGAKTVTIPASQTTATYDVPTVDDGTAEHNGSVTATLNAGLGYTIGAPSEATVAVHDPVQLPEATGTIPNASVVVGATHEVDAASYFTGTVVTYTASSSDTDTATVAVGNTSTVTVTGVALGTATITVRATNLAGPTEQTFIVTVAADPALPVITIAAGADATEGTDAVFTVTASVAPQTDLTVNLSFSVDGVYTLTNQPSTVTIAANTMTKQSAPNIANNAIHQPSGSVTATVTAGTGYTVGAADSDSVTVTDNETRPNLTVTSPGVAECASGTTAIMRFTVTSTGASTYPVGCWTQGGTATNDVDYVGRNTHTSPTTHLDFSDP